MKYNFICNQRQIIVSKIHLYYLLFYNIGLNYEKTLLNLILMHLRQNIKNNNNIEPMDTDTVSSEILEIALKKTLGPDRIHFWLKNFGSTH